MDMEVELILTKLQERVVDLERQLQNNRNGLHAIVSLLEQKGIIADDFEFIVELARQEKKAEKLREELFNIPEILD